MTDVPPGWAVLTKDGKTEYVLALFAETAADAEEMSAAEARRFVVAFAESVAEWMKGTWCHRSRARDEYDAEGRKRALAQVFDADVTGGKRTIHFEEWSIGEILKAARGERALLKAARGERAL